MNFGNYGVLKYEEIVLVGNSAYDYNKMQNVPRKGGVRGRCVGQILVRSHTVRTDLDWCGGYGHLGQSLSMGRP